MLDILMKAYQDDMIHRARMYSVLNMREYL